MDKDKPFDFNAREHEITGRDMPMTDEQWRQAGNRLRAIKAELDAGQEHMPLPFEHMLETHGAPEEPSEFRDAFDTVYETRDQQVAAIGIWLQLDHHMHVEGISDHVADGAMDGIHNIGDITPWNKDY